VQHQQLEQAALLLLQQQRQQIGQRRSTSGRMDRLWAANAQAGATTTYSMEQGASTAAATAAALITAKAAVHWHLYRQQYLVGEHLRYCRLTVVQTVLCMYRRAALMRWTGLSLARSHHLLELLFRQQQAAAVQALGRWVVCTQSSMACPL
jgi:steroid 5-alpha reductase family enzyme